MNRNLLCTLHLFMLDFENYNHLIGYIIGYMYLLICQLLNMNI